MVMSKTYSRCCAHVEREYVSLSLTPEPFGVSDRPRPDGRSVAASLYFSQCLTSAGRKHPTLLGCEQGQCGLGAAAVGSEGCRRRCRQGEGLGAVAVQDFDRGREGQKMSCTVRLCRNERISRAWSSPEKLLLEYLHQESL